MTTQNTEEPLDGPLDRLKYFNGQRLEARDLQVEQDYHIRVRRQLNQALYTPGIAKSLEVTASENKHAVVVSPGVALDALGREVILLEETEVPVRGLPNTNPAWVYGNFLTIQYAEEDTASSNDGCSLASGKQELAWGGPTRIRAVPVLGFADAWPNEKADGYIILAQVELDAGCAVAQIHNQVRKYVDAANTAIRSFALEGEKDIVKTDPKTISFHISGGSPTSIMLYLRGGRISPMWYTELPEHSHEVDLTTSDAGGDSSGHQHDVIIGDIDASDEEGHSHDIEGNAFVESGDTSLRLRGGGTLTDLSAVIDAKAKKAGKHSHTVSIGTITTDPSGTSADHGHSITGQTTETTGVAAGESGGARIVGTELTYLDEIEVNLDGEPITEAIRTQLGGPANGWEKLGDGSSDHKLVKEGTGPIALERIATINQGEHTLEFKVENNSGGNIRYNLYVE